MNLIHPERLIFALATALLLLAVQACRIDDIRPRQQLPLETQEGRNTIGCLVNGTVWRHGCGCFIFGPPSLEADYSRGQFWISARKSDTKDERNNSSIYIITKNEVFSPGIYRLAAEPDGYGNFRIKNSCDYQTDSLNTGTLEITRLDTVNFIISGRFNFRVTSPGCETINITDGRFDIRYPL